MTDTISMEDMLKLCKSFPDPEHYLVPQSVLDDAESEGIVIPSNFHGSKYMSEGDAYKVSAEAFRMMQPQFLFKPEFEITSPPPADAFINTHMHDLSNAIGVIIPYCADLGVSMNQIRTMIHVMVRHHYVPGRKRRGGISRRKMSK